MKPATGTGASPARSTVSVNGWLRKMAVKPDPEIARPSWSRPSPTGSTDGTATPPTASDATSRPPSRRVGHRPGRMAGSTGGDIGAWRELRMKLVTWSPAASRARTVSRTGRSVGASGGTWMVTGTLDRAARRHGTSGWDGSSAQPGALAAVSRDNRWSAPASLPAGPACPRPAGRRASTRPRPVTSG